MVSREEVEKQLKQIGCYYRFWGRSEIAELPHALMEGETIKCCVNGHYTGGFAMLCVTDHRLLLVDKKPFNYLNIEDIRFETISEFDYHHRLLDSDVHICTPVKTMVFTSWNHHRLRALLQYVQQRVIEIRQYYYLAQQFQQMAAQQLREPQPPPAYVPNLAVRAAQAVGWTGEPAPKRGTAASVLGAYTYVKLPHFNRYSSRRLGRYAIFPDEIYPPQLA